MLDKLPKASRATVKRVVGLLKSPPAEAAAEPVETPRRALYRRERTPIADVVPQGTRRQLPPLKPPLPAGRAATLFVEWMQDHGFFREYPFSGPNGIWEHYLWHCHEMRFTPIPENTFGEHLKKLVVNRQATERTGGKRGRRYQVYAISEPQIEDAPRKKAA